MLHGLEDIEGLTAEQISAINEKAGGILSKNEELLGKLNKTKEYAGQSAAEIEALRLFKQNADTQAAEDASNWDKAKTLMTEQHLIEVEKLTGQAKESGELVQKLLVDDGLNKALDSIRVNPALKSGAEAMLRSQVTITEGKAVVGDKSLSEYVTEWSQTDAGKAFCLATQNSGGNANGGDGGNSSNTDKLEGLDKVKANLNQRLKERGLVT